MKAALRRLKKRIIFLAFTIACAIILVMLILLYASMSFSYDSKINTAAELISQSAVRSTQNIMSEQLDLSTLDRDEKGDFVIERNPLDVESITLHGKITCEHEASWYSAGGGLVLTAYADEEKTIPIYFYQEYSFNKDVSEITIDFPDFSKFQGGGAGIFDIHDADISDDIFFISQAWWASSEGCDNGTDQSVKLDLQYAVLKYKEGISPVDLAGQNVIASSFSDLFDSGVPDIVNGISSFVLLTDKNNNLIEVNSGNLISPVSRRDAAKYIIESDSHESCRIGGVSYTCKRYDNDDTIIRVYVCSSDKKSSLRQLALLSVCLGVGVAVLIFILIYIISGKIVGQLAVSYDKQNQFISNASHELKTPITVISATTDIIERNSGSDKWLGTIKAQVDKMQKLLQEMLELTKMNESVEKHPDFVQFQLSQLIENNVLYFESRAYEENRTLVSDIEPNVVFTGLPDKIEELVGIMLDNALKYSDDGGEIKISLRSEKNSITLKCSNPCAGFSTENTDRLFERFYRSDESHSDEKEGFGLGLSIAQLIVIQHKGTIGVSSENGTVTFTINIPNKM